MPRYVTLTDVRVDGQSSSILVEDNSFATIVKGRGSHQVTAEFQVTIQKDSGPPKITLPVPEVPVSRLDLELPGRKEVTVHPTSNVTTKTTDDGTVATAYVPMTSSVTLAWSEAVPESVKAELRANAGIYHTVFAEEGVLYMQAIAQYEITRGETSVIELVIPENIQVNRITSPSGVISDWRVTKEKDKQSVLKIFLDRKIDASHMFTINYDRSILKKDAGKDFSVPLLKANNVHRQRGMVALLSSKELTLSPVKEEELTRVGENQLPAFVKQTVDKTIAHTFKYVESSPLLMVKAEKPERKQGKFDALVHTLISLGDVTMTGSATVEVNVKSGSIEDLLLNLPTGVNFLSLSAPSLRTHNVNQTDTGQEIEVQFTQEMEGQFRLELAYELIMSDAASSVKVPTLKVNGAEVEQGRIAVEALSAVEVQASETEGLSTVDPSELPQQLILKTTNPILLAYKYVHADPPYSLALKVTRHKQLEVQTAAIDSADYMTLYTRDGLAVTTASFIVRNSRKQFLKVQLPKDSKVWTVFVDGKPEKPALAEPKEGMGPQVLIKIINSAQGFPVTMIYQMPVSEIGSFGSIEGTLPKPDMIVTRTRWDLYLPDDLTYGEPDTNMDVIVEGRYVPRSTMRREISKVAPQQQQIGSLALNVPAAGKLYRFEKLYANQTGKDTTVSMMYVSGLGEFGSILLVVLGTIVFWLGLLGFYLKKNKIVATAATVLGFGVACIAIGYLGGGILPAIITSVLCLLVFWQQHREATA